jgi:hypothetical protein
MWNGKRRWTINCHEDTKQYKRNWLRLQSGEHEMKAKTQNSHLIIYQTKWQVKTTGWVIVVKRQLCNFLIYIRARKSWFSMRWWWGPVCSRTKAWLDLNIASLLEIKITGWYVAPLGHIILIPSQPVFALSP